jgi:hypothetical protein
MLLLAPLATNHASNTKHSLTCTSSEISSGIDPDVSGLEKVEKRATIF